VNARSEDWQRIKALFEACLDSGPVERARLLEHDDSITPQIRAEVHALLAAQAAAPSMDNAAAWCAPLFAAEANAPEPMPERIGPYNILRELGRGGMGVVWLAERDDAGAPQRVALKRIRGGYDDVALRARFGRERAILARLNHDRIARLLDGGVDESGPWFALEYVQGEPITRWCDARRLTVRERARLLLDVLDGVAYAHRNLIVHRDLKPGNVLVTDEGRVKLLDFGIAKLLDESEDLTRTDTGAQVLTPACAAPEQLRGEQVSTATDIYALGVLLYQLATGQLPYAADASSRAALAQAVLHETPERAARALMRSGVSSNALATARSTGTAALQRELDREFEQILGIALAKEPERRYASADAFAADLHAWIERRPLLSRPAPRLRRALQFVRRHRVGAAAAALIAATTIAGISATLWQARLAVRHAATERAVREFTTSLFAAIDPDQARGREVPLREVLDVGARQAENGLKDQPSVRGALLSDLGAIYTSLGDTARGIALLSMARESLAAAPERDRDELARAWLRLAEAQYALADYARAAESTDAALALLADRPVTDPMRVEGEILHARIDEDADRLDAAARRIEGLVAVLRNDTRIAPSRVADALSALGNLRRLQARYEDAEAAEREALDVERRADPDNPMIASRLHELASAEQQTGKAQDGIAHLREAYALHQKVHGALHPLTLSTEGELAQALANGMNLDEAEALFKRNIENRRNLFGATHSEVGKPLNNYALALYLRHRYAEAVPLFEQAWTIWRATLGEDHVNTRTAASNYAASLLETGDYARAEPLLVKAVEQTQKLDPPRLQSSKFNSYAILLEKTNRLEQSEQVLRRSLQLAIDGNNGQETQYPWNRTLLGRVLRKRGNLAQAREQLEKALAAYDADDLPDGPKTATCLYQLALVRNALHEPAATIKPLLERALAAQEAKLGKEHAESVATRDLLAKLH